jgi:hypothetical protein
LLLLFLSVGEAAEACVYALGNTFLLILTNACIVKNQWRHLGFQLTCRSRDSARYWPACARVLQPFSKIITRD